MNCPDIDDVVISYLFGKPIPREAAAHIAECGPCSRVAAAIRQAPKIDELPRQQLKRIEDRIVVDLKPVKPLPAAGVLHFAQLSIFVIVVVTGILILGSAGWHALNLLQKVVVFGALATDASLLTFSAVRQMAPGSGLQIPPYLLVTVALGGMAGIFTTLFLPNREATFVSTGLACLKIGLECAIPAAALLWLVLRRGAVLRPMLTGATAGVLAGLSGLTVLETFCPNVNKYHILVWHLGAVLASVAGGLAIGLLAERSAWKGSRRSL